MRSLWSRVILPKFHLMNKELQSTQVVESTLAEPRYGVKKGDMIWFKFPAMVSLENVTPTVKVLTKHKTVLLEVKPLNEITLEQLRSELKHLVQLFDLKIGFSDPLELLRHWDNMIQLKLKENEALVAQKVENPTSVKFEIRGVWIDPAAGENKVRAITQLISLS